MDLAARHVRAQRGHMELDIRRPGARHHACKQATLVDADGERSLPEEQPFKADARVANDGAQLIVGGDRHRAAINETKLQMILQIFADPGAIDDDRDAVLAQRRGGADSRHHEQVRRLDRSGAQNHAAPRPNHAVLRADAAFDPGGAPLLEQDACSQRLRDDPQVSSFSRRPQIGLGGGDTPAVLHRQLIVARSFLRLAVEIVCSRDAARLRRRYEGFDQLMPPFDAADRHRPAAAVQLALGLIGIALRLDEIRQHVVPRPAGVSKPGPMVVILVLAADRNQPIDRARSAEHATARPVDPASVHVGIGLGVELPVDEWVPHRAAVSDRQLNPEPAVVRPRLQQGDAVARIGGEPVGQHATGGTRADDDEVELAEIH